MKFNPITRRYFLQGLGGSVLALPFLESMVPKAFAAIAPPNPLRRFICVCNANGTYRADWFPTVASNAIPLVGTTHRAMNLTDVQGPVAGAVSQLVGPEFANLRSKMLMLRNVSSLFPPDRGHQMASVLAGNLGRVWGPAKYLLPSIDQIMANSAKIYPTAPAVRALHLRTFLNGGEPEIDLSWDYRNGLMELPTQYSQPLTAFNAVFKTAGAPPPGSKNNLLVDQVLSQYNALKANTRATASDKTILDDHMAMVAQLQTNVQNMACTTPAPTKTYAQNAIDRGPMLDIYIQMLVAAIKCNATRIATLTLAPGVDGTNFDALLGINTGGDWHNHGHTAAGEASADMRKVHIFHQQKFASLLNQLNVAEPGTNGTYLDNSIVMLGNEQADHTGHTYLNRPILLAGSGGGVLQTNKFIDYAPQPGGRADYNRLLITLMQSMGLDQADYYTAEMKARGIQPGYGDDRGAGADRNTLLTGIQVGG